LFETQLLLTKVQVLFEQQPFLAKILLFEILTPLVENKYCLKPSHFELKHFWLQKRVIKRSLNC